MPTRPEPLSTLRNWLANIERVIDFFYDNDYESWQIGGVLQAALIFFEAIQPSTNRLFGTFDLDRRRTFGWVNRTLKRPTALQRSIIAANILLRRARQISMACANKPRFPETDEIAILHASIHNLNQHLESLTNCTTLSLKDLAWLHSCSTQDAPFQVDGSLLAAVRSYGQEQNGVETELRYWGAPFFTGHRDEVTKLTKGQRCVLQYVAEGGGVDLGALYRVNHIRHRRRFRLARWA